MNFIKYFLLLSLLFSSVASAQYCSLYFKAKKPIVFDSSFEKDVLTRANSALDDVVKMRKEALKSDSQVYPRKLDFEIRRSNSEVAVLAKNIFDKKMIDGDISKLIKARSKNLSDKAEDVVVIGGGPLGMISAIKAWKLGKNVTIIERRGIYNREQILGIDRNFQKWFRDEVPQLYKQMHELGIFQRKPGWHSLKKNLSDAKNFDSVRIQQMENSLALYIKRIQDVSSESSFQVMRNTRLVGKVDDELSGFILKVETSDLQKMDVPARFIIGADGAAGPSKFLFNRQVLTTTNNHYAGTGIFRASSKDATSFSKTFGQKDLRDIFELNPNKEKILKNLQKLGWKKDKIPAVRIFQNGDTFYIGAEIPQTLEIANSMINSPDLRLKWFSELKDLAFPKELIGKLRPIMRGTTAFPVESVRLDQFYSKSQYGNGIYAAVGDNAMTPHFMTRSGINHGFQHVQIMEKSILSKSFDEVSDKTLRGYNTRIVNNSEKLFAKPVSNNFFTDGPFLKNINLKEQKVVTYLLKKGAPVVNYTNHLRLLKEFNITLSNKKILNQVAEHLKLNPRVGADDFAVFLEKLI